MKEDKYMIDQKEEDDDLFHIIKLSSEYDRSTLVGKLIYIWQWRFFFKNYNKAIKLKDIPKGRRIDGADYVYNEFQKYWKCELKRASKKKRKPNLLYPIFHQYGLELLVLGTFCFIGHYAQLVQALYLDDLIRGFNDLNDLKKDTKSEIIQTSIMMVVIMIVFSSLSNIFHYFSWLMALRVRVCLSEFIYRKSLRLSKSAIGKTSIGQITNFLSTDMNRIDFFFNVLPYPFTGFTLFAYAVYKLWKYLSYHTLFGVIFLFLVLPIQSIIGALFSKMRSKAAIYTDERLKLVDEFINAIKVIKCYTWEFSFAEKINLARKREIAKIKNSLYIYSLTTGGSITDKIVFLTLSVFNQITFLITIFVPHFILCGSNFMISIRRINKFLTLEEKNEDSSDHAYKNGINLKPSLEIPLESLKSNGFHKKLDENFNLSIKNLTASYSLIESMDNPNFLLEDNASCKSYKLFDALKNFNFNCKQNELLIVVGPVGSGKTSLLQAILSELRIKEGKIEVNGRLSYACQEPWIFASSIKENILFDSEYDEKKYDEVIRVCALERDLTLFPDGDQTFIGERGVALSGGQKARINLARALYFDADIYLLDDPLSAVDSHVCKFIFKEAISEFLKHKTVILVTHQLNYIKYADKVLFIKEGEQILFETAEKILKILVDSPESDFTKFIGNNFEKQQSRKRQSSVITNGSSISIPQSLISRKNSLSSNNDPAIVFDEKYVQNQLKEVKKTERERKQQEEDDQVRFAYKSYVDYFKYGRIKFWGPILILAFGITQIFATSCDVFIKVWADQVKSSQLNSTPNETSSDKEISYLTYRLDLIFARLIADYGVYFYTIIIVCFFTTSLTRTMLHSIFSMTASINIHNNLFRRIVRAKMKFFYTNSIGVILNRFSRDIASMDDDLPFYFYDFLEILFNSTVILVVMTISSFFLIIPFSIFITLVLIFRKFYIKTARTLETLEGVGKSPIIHHLSSTLNGLSTVRAFKTEDKFIKKFNKYQNDHTAIHFTSITSRRWFSYVLDNLQMIFVGGSLMVLILFAEKFGGSLIGLIVAYVLTFSGEFQWCIICWSNLETHLCSVDRIERICTDLDVKDSNKSLAEPPIESNEDSKPPPDWPKKGIIEFRNVTMRYYENENPVLKNLNFTIEENHKLGIVGRTGAGKSSIIAALFRLTEYEGDIIIDGVNAKSIGLHDLRGCISIIPQEPCLFTGTVRSNLDPLEIYTDDQLWNALKVTQLDQVIKELEGGLDSKVIDNGGNFSVGQKQLICLARAVLKENKILVLDEATANVDVRTDELIQSTIRTVFKHCSIITIAHRLNTIMDSTKILVLDAGEVREFDTPDRLLQNEDGLFTSMLNASGEK